MKTHDYCGKWKCTLNVKIIVHGKLLEHTHFKSRVCQNIGFDRFAFGYSLRDEAVALRHKHKH